MCVTKILRLRPRTPLVCGDTFRKQLDRFFLKYVVGIRVSPKHPIPTGIFNTIRDKGVPIEKMIFLKDSIYSTFFLELKTSINKLLFAIFNRFNNSQFYFLIIKFMFKYKQRRHQYIQPK